jgi:nicotinate-nucleotide adenylyltransferase
MKIGLLGGSFNPPHLGHIGISKEALRLLNLDQIWWLPTKQNPLKSQKPDNFDKRFTLCQEISQNEPKIIIKDTEKQIKSNFFIDLLTNITKKHPKDNFYLLIGSDNLINFHQWHKYQDILSLTKLAIIEREGHHQQALESITATSNQKDRLIFLKNNKYNISSTKLRTTND